MLRYRAKLILHRNIANLASIRSTGALEDMNDSGIELVQFTQVRNWIDGRYSWACRFFFHVPCVDDNGKNTHGSCANNQP